MATRIRFVGGRTTGLVNTVIRGVLGIGFIIAGIVAAIIQKEFLLFVILGAIGIVALLNAWWWYRRAQKF